MTTIKVVYNACYGGFSVSQKAAERLAELGVEEARESLDMAKDPDAYFMRNSHCYRIARHNPHLVQVVEELGAEANGRCAKLAICTISGNMYRIDEYDGYESVIEPDSYQDWIVVQDEKH